MICFRFLILFFLSHQLSSTSQAAGHLQTVLIRDLNQTPRLVEVQLPDLVSMTHFDGKNFKIVLGKNETPLSLYDPDEERRLRAATAYYHLVKARNFWIRNMSSDHVRNMPQLTVRIDITNRFSDLGHFQNDAIDPQYNNALSIPAGKPLEGIDIPEWGNEVWFRPVKTIRTEDLPSSGLDAEGNPLNKYLSVLSAPIKSSLTSRLIQISLQKIFYPDTLLQSYKNSILNQLGIFAAVTLLTKASQHADRLFMSKYFYLDTAMVPEIIYHEYSHIALSDQLSLSLSTPMLEGMADYFATRIGDTDHIGEYITQYAMSRSKNARNKDLYDPIFETTPFANSDFVLSVLWLIGNEFPELGDQIIFRARTKLATESSNIRHDFVRALLMSCSEICKNPRADRMKMREIFEQKGF